MEYVASYCTAFMTNYECETEAATLAYGRSCEQRLCRNEIEMTIANNRGSLNF
jgi:hypothetical protein